MVVVIVKVDSVNRQHVKVRSGVLVAPDEKDLRTEEMSAKGSSPSSAPIRSFLPFFTLPRFRTVKRRGKGGRGS